MRKNRTGSSFLFFSLILLVVSSSVLHSSTIFQSEFMVLEEGVEAGTLAIASIYDTTIVQEPVLVELLQSKILQRLQHVRQHGNWHFCGQKEDYSRFEHSVNVFLLVKKAGGSLLEQVAALLHDVSHTVFSHSGATFFEDDFLKADHLQDDMHQFCLEHGEIADILSRHGIFGAAVMPENPEFVRLEQELPALCSDRIEYNITGSLYEGLISRDQALQMIKCLCFSSEAKSWYFKDRTLAYIFARNAAYMAIAVWTSPYSVVSTKMLGYALRRAGYLGLLTKEDVLFGTDDAIFHKMEQSSDHLLQKLLDGVVHPDHLFDLNPTHDRVMPIVCKFRGVDPLVEHEGDLRRLSSVCKPFKWYLDHMKMLFKAGWPVVYNKNVAEDIAIFLARV